MKSMRTKAKVTVQIVKELFPDFVGDVLVTAFDGNYGGCNYWITEVTDLKPAREEGQVVMDWEWESLRIKFHLDSLPAIQRGRYETPLMIGVGVKVDAETIAKGIQGLIDDRNGVGAVAEELTRAVSFMDAGEIDAGLADMIVQQGLFDEVILG